MASFTVPLSAPDANLVRHYFESMCIATALGLAEPGDYGLAIRHLTQLLEGQTVDIDEALLADSRAILAQAARAAGT